eukprot:gene3803-8379_t
MIKSLFLIAAVATVLSFFILTNAQDDVDVNELEKQWGIEDDFEEELMKRRPPMPEIKPGKKLSPKDMEQLMNTQHAGKPTMLFITMKGDERAENERLAGLKNSHMPVKSFFIEDDHFGLIVDDGKYVPQVIKYLKQQKDIAQYDIISHQSYSQITLDQKDLLPPHPKTSVKWSYIWHICLESTTTVKHTGMA